MFPNYKKKKSDTKSFNLYQSFTQMFYTFVSRYLSITALNYELVDFCFSKYICQISLKYKHKLQTNQ